MSSQNNSTNSSSASRAWEISFTDRHIEFLCESTAQGITRWEAFNDLLGMMQVRPSVVTLPYNDPITLWPGQLQVNITELSARWKWARITIRAFLDTLEEMGLLQRCQLNRCSVITMSVVFPYLSAEDVGRVPKDTGEAEIPVALQSDESEPGVSIETPFIPILEDEQDLRL